MQKKAQAEKAAPKQLNLFATGIVCECCHEDPGRGKNPSLWNGFYDQDTNQYICTNCKPAHYIAKAQTEHKGLYSEVPVVVKTWQINQEIQEKKSRSV